MTEHAAFQQRDAYERSLRSDIDSLARKEADLRARWRSSDKGARVLADSIRDRRCSFEALLDSMAEPIVEGDQPELPLCDMGAHVESEACPGCDQ